MREKDFKAFFTVIGIVMIVGLFLSFFVYAGIGVAAWSIASHFLNM